MRSGQFVGQVGNEEVADEIDEDDGLQRFQVRPTGGVGVDQVEIRELKRATEEDE